MRTPSLRRILFNVTIREHVYLTRHTYDLENSLGRFLFPADFYLVVEEIYAFHLG